MDCSTSVCQLYGKDPYGDRPFQTALSDRELKPIYQPLSKLPDFFEKEKNSNIILQNTGVFV